MEYLFYAAMPYLVQMYSFLFINGYCRVTGLVFIIIDAYYIIETFLNNQRAIFIGGTLRQRRNGQLTMSRKKQCQKLHFSFGFLPFFSFFFNNHSYT